jgi:hypothetical protein
MANFAFYALHKLRIKPSEFLEMDEYEKAFVIASIQIRNEEEEKQNKELEKQSKKGRRR